MREETRRESETKLYRRRNYGFARRANLPTSGELRGWIVIVQEDRFRLEDEGGNAYLLTAGRKAGVSMEDLHRWREGKTIVTVRYEGPPDMGAVATEIRV